MNLVLISKKDFDVELDIKYATSANFVGKEIYKKHLCYLHSEAATKLSVAIELAKRINLKIKIFDGFRPLEAQKKLWDFLPNANYVSNPDGNKLPHCRAIAIDLTLVDAKNNELDMGTEFDCFSERSHHLVQGLNDKQNYNRFVLQGIMTLAGFEHHPNEWWHYQLPKYQNYKILDEDQTKTKLLLD